MRSQGVLSGPRRGTTVAAVVVALSAVAGATVGLLVATAGAAGRFERGDGDPGRLIAATHLPPLLTLPGERITLRYDVYCAPPGADPEDGRPCDAAGTLYLRPAGGGAFRPVALRLDPTAGEGRYVADLPPEAAGAVGGFEYYAVLRSRTTGASTTLPAGGPFAPERSRPLAHAVEVRLGPHAFGKTAAATARVAAAAWGNGAGQVGLEQGPELQPIGGASFDVGAAGAVSLLDEANHRVLRFEPGVERPVAVPIAVRGTIADLALGSDGTMAVLESVGDGGETPLLQTFDQSGRTRTAVHIAEHDASSVEFGPDGPVTLQYPAGQWMPVADHGVMLGAVDQRRRARGGRVTPDGLELVVQREGGEARIAEVDARGVRRAWRIESSTALGEVQLARRLGADVVVALRVYTDTRDEFEILVLGDEGIVRQFAIESRTWAETAPLARLRLRGSSLYELASDRGGVYVDRYDLEQSR